jgi:hypothetical protein
MKAVAENAGLPVNQPAKQAVRWAISHAKGKLRETPKTKTAAYNTYLITAENKF